MDNLGKVELWFFSIGAIVVGAGIIKLKLFSTLAKNENNNNCSKSDTINKTSKTNNSIIPSTIFFRTIFQKICNQSNNSTNNKDAKNRRPFILHRLFFTTRKK
jgi:hypothetical protein